MTALERAELVPRRLPALFRGLLRCYPAAFRSEVEAELRDVIMQVRDDTRDQTRLTRLRLDASLAESVFSDLRSALRGIMLRRGFATMVILTLGVGIGGVTAMWSVVYGVLLRPLPYPHSDRLLRVWMDVSDGKQFPSNHFAVAGSSLWRGPTVRRPSNRWPRITETLAVRSKEDRIRSKFLQPWFLRSSSG